MGFDFMFWKKKTNEEASPYVEPTIKDVGPGGVITIDEEDYTVEAKNRYSTDDGSCWYELKLYDAKGNIRWLEWEEDDKLLITLTYEKLSLEDMGLGPEDMERFDEEEKGSFEYKGRRYFYDESDEAYFYRDCKEPRERLYYWDFEDEEEEYVIGVERWGKKWEVSACKYLEEREITIYKTGD